VNTKAGSITISLDEMVRNPYLLTMIIDVYIEEGSCTKTGLL
jgi:hypothetical protein